MVGWLLAASGIIHIFTKVEQVLASLWASESLASENSLTHLCVLVNLSAGATCQP